MSTLGLLASLRPRSTSRLAGAIALGALGLSTLGPTGCGESDPVTAASTTTTTTTGAGGAGGATTAAGGSGGATTTAAGGSGGATTTATGGAGGAGGATTTTTGEGGAGGAPVGAWPDCTTQPKGSFLRTIPDLWAANPPKQTKAGTWVPGVYVTAISAGGCVAGTECQVFLQQDETYADLAAGAKHAIKLFASNKVSEHFTSLKVGDKVDAFGSAWRSTLNGANELEIDVNLAYPGCANVVGTGDPKPVQATLADLTIAGYEDTIGPLLVQADLVSGKPTSNTAIFGMWPTGQFPDGGPEGFVSLSFYFLQGQAFSGLTIDKLHDFSSVAGVFGELLMPGPTKFRVIYPRQMTDVVIAKVH